VADSLRPVLYVAQTAMTSSSARITRITPFELKVGQAAHTTAHPCKPHHPPNLCPAVLAPLPSTIDPQLAFLSYFLQPPLTSRPPPPPTFTTCSIRS
jgi:hypothetical protein